MEANKWQPNSSDSNTHINSQQKSTPWPFANRTSVANFTNVQNVFSTGLYNYSESGLVNSVPFTSSPVSREVTPSYDYLTEVPDVMSNSLGGGAKENAENEFLTRGSPTMTDKLSETSPAPSSYADPSTLVSVSPVTPQGVFLTTVGLKGVQRETPETAKTVTAQPALFAGASKNEFANITELHPSANEMATQPTEDLHWWDTKKQDEASERILPNASISEPPAESSSSRLDAYWMVGNWSDVSGFVFVFS